MHVWQNTPLHQVSTLLDSRPYTSHMFAPTNLNAVTQCSLRYTPNSIVPSLLYPRRKHVHVCSILLIPWSPHIDVRAPMVKAGIYRLAHRVDLRHHLFIRYG